MYCIYCYNSIYGGRIFFELTIKFSFLNYMYYCSQASRNDETIFVICIKYAAEYKH